MKLTISQLKQIINEELSLIDEELTEEEASRLPAAAAIIQVYVTETPGINRDTSVSAVLDQIAKEFAETV